MSREKRNTFPGGEEVRENQRTEKEPTTRGTEDRALSNRETLEGLEYGSDDQKGKRKQSTCLRIHPYSLILRGWTTRKKTAISLIISIQGLPG